jgi:diguanylate cyclase
LFNRTRHTPAVTNLAAEPAELPGYGVLRFLAEQGLQATPANYALAYNRAIDRRGMLAMAVDSILMDGRRITQADADRITTSQAKRDAQSGAGGDDQQQAALRHQTLRLAELASGAASGSNAFGRDLSEGLNRIASGDAPIEQIVAVMIEQTRGVEAQLIAASQKIEQLRNEVEAVRDDAMRDALTGLLNRRGLNDELRSRAKRSVGTVALCDIDHFKTVNDQYGHAVGDRVLRGVAASLSESLGIHQIARWGGEEFLIVIDGATPQEALPLLERARRDLADRCFKLHDTGAAIGQVTVSIGVASLTNTKADAAVEAADRLLYRAKNEGRNRVVVA